MKYLNDTQKANLFRKLATLPYYETGLEFGLDKHYSSPSSVKGAVRKVFSEVAQDPEKFHIHPETVDVVQESIQARSAAPIKKQSIAEKDDAPKNIEEMITQNRNLASEVIRKKLGKINKSKKALDSVGLSQLTTAFGILFDKSQIIKGQATEHIAMMGKIDTNMDPKSAIDMVVKMREQEVAEKAIKQS